MAEDRQNCVHVIEGDQVAATAAVRRTKLWILGFVSVLLTAVRHGRPTGHTRKNLAASRLATAPKPSNTASGLTTAPNPLPKLIT